ncbi:GNAT family N-acetyltransferase [Halosimplex salinum]|uniref:GNAT family N-acetyltransferase n=1 Tax=Halosimplex salinum TaxID=1710538 RepID=UPI000F482027|nr:N-acetyltransferase [Halosimplex salinum]
MTRVRPGETVDLPALRAIQTTVLAEQWDELLAVAPDGPPILLVAETERTGAVDAADTPVGYALAVTDGDDEACYLAELAVAPDSQGEGHGSALLDALTERCREIGVDDLRVTVREVDDRAREFYEERGFERRERLPDHYESGDGLLLVRELPE